MGKTKIYITPKKQQTKRNLAVKKSIKKGEYYPKQNNVQKQSVEREVEYKGLQDVKIIRIDTHDVRFPTAKTSQGTDALHSDPNYSACYVQLITNKNHPTGNGIIFTIGRGNEVAQMCVKLLSQIIIGKRLQDIIDNFREIWFQLTNDCQLRWIGPEKGVVHLAVAGIVNAIWDLWGKCEKKPLWQLLTDLEPEQLVKLLNFKYVTDEFTEQDALKILKQNRQNNSIPSRIQEIHKIGFPAYTTAAGWSGYSEEKVKELVDKYKKQGFKHFKVKVGLGYENDFKRCQHFRKCLGDDCIMMMDANQIWSVEEAIENMTKLSVFNPLWIEEPTAPDDVIGHQKIKEALKKFNVGVATGEHAHNRILHKHFMKMGGYTFCQTDPVRLGGMNELILVCLMAKHFNIPVCLHSGGVGLCEMGVHTAIFDYICISQSHENRIFEYADALHEHFKNPVQIQNGHYLPPEAYGFASDIKEESLKQYLYPDGPYWKKNQKM